MAVFVTNAGLALIVNKLTGTDTTNTPGFINWGTGATAAAKTATTISTESAETRVTGVKTSQTTTVAGDTFQVTGTQTAASTQSITNAGVLTASTAGTLFIIADFSTIPVVTGDSVAFTFKDALS